MAKGDQLYVLREFFNIPGVYEHHGIDCGDGTVIHYRKTSDAVGRIERSPLLTFSAGKTVYVKSYETCFIPDVVVARAESRLGETSYNLLSNNCEHFATWCKTGYNYSQQVQDFVPNLDRIPTPDLGRILEPAMGGVFPDSTSNLLQTARQDVAMARQSLTGQLSQAKTEADTWNRVAQLALRRQREDLARAALQRKVVAKRQVKELQKQLDQLQEIATTLQRNQAKV